MQSAIDFRLFKDIMGPIKPKNPFMKELQLGTLQSSEPSLPSPQGKTHPHSAVPPSHPANRQKCCLVCWRWAKLALNDTLKSEIQRLFSIEIDFSDPRVPLGVCSSCKVGLYAFKSTNVNSKKLKLQHTTFDHVLIPPPTRSEPKCSCIICTVGKGPITTGKFKKLSEI